MTRDEVLDRYRPLRAGIERILSEAPRACRKAEMKRALSEIAPWAEQSQLVGGVLDMMIDVAFFEPDRGGQRTVDRFLTRHGKGLSADDRDLVANMSQAWFSLFRVAGRHDAAGIWLEDLLDGDRRVWLMDENLETWAEPNLIFGLRVFAAGPFHAAFGIITQPSDDILGACLAAQARRVPLPTDVSLAAMAYADYLAEEMRMSDDELDTMDQFADLIISSASLLIDQPKAGAKKKGCLGCLKGARRSAASIRFEAERNDDLQGAMVGRC